MHETSPHIWQLRSGADKRFRAGHPWVYSNELAGSPRDVAPGDPVELRDAAGRFLARGYGNPHTLIAFRALSRDAGEAAPGGEAGLLARLRRAAALRHALGLGAVSHRLVFGEADDLPGLVVDRYRLADGAGGADEDPAQVLVVQQHTAGAGRLHDALLAALEMLVGEERASDPTAPDWAHTGVVLRNDTGARRLEGLVEEPPRVLCQPPGTELTRATVLVPAPPEVRAEAAPGPAGAPFMVDLVGGQKTGFFLDQGANVRLAAGLLAPLLRSRAGTGASGPLRILDLFTYVGQWGVQLARVARTVGGTDGVHVTALDASTSALELATANVAAAGAACDPVRADVMQGLEPLAPRSFDVVIADPPAFIKGRKAYHTGRAAYVKLNAAALRLVRPGGLVVTCSCSQLLDEADFAAVLHKAAGRAEVPVRWVAQGGQGPDHPVLAGFPEGRYLKCWVGVVG
ncbi:MAG TPA: methyltransferase [bacterium]|nr:methyltransferase [bacterium]